MMKESSVFDASTVINKSSVLLCLPPGIMEFVPPKGSLVLPERISSVGFKDIDTLDEVEDQRDNGQLQVSKGLAEN